MRKITGFILCFILVGSTSLLIGQSFEGSITYKLTAQNPNPEMISDEMWQESIKSQFGERGYMLQKYYYKNDKYISEIEAGGQLGYQAYNPTDGLLYSWAKDSKEAVTVDSKKYLDELDEIIQQEETKEILGITCKSLLIKSSFGSLTIWYNPDYLKMDPSLYKGHKYGHFIQILEEIGCLPLMMVQESAMANFTIEAIEYKEETVNAAKFTIPEFESITANPIN